MGEFFKIAGEGKTGQREVAVLILLLWALGYLRVMYFIAPADVHHYESIFVDLTWPMLILVAVAFGFKGVQNILAMRMGGQQQPQRRAGDRKEPKNDPPAG